VLGITSAWRLLGRFGYHFSSLVMSIVRSDMFRMNQKVPATVTARAAAN